MLEVLLQPLTQWIRDLMESNELPHAQHLSVIPCGARVQSLNDRGYITEDTGVHEGWKIWNADWIRKEHWKLCVGLFAKQRDLHPTSITHTVNIFSVSVFGATLPNPTEVREVKVKYRAVMYRDWSEEES